MDAQAYQQGYTEGLKQFCTEEMGYTYGLNNALSDSGICPQDIYPAFTKAFKLGREVRLLKDAREANEKAIKDMNEDRSVVADIDRFSHLLNGTSRTQQLEERNAELTGEIAKLEAQAPIPALHPALSSEGFGDSLAAFVGMIKAHEANCSRSRRRSSICRSATTRRC